MIEKNSESDDLADFIERKLKSALKTLQIKTNPETILAGRTFILIDGYSQDYEDPIKTTRAVEAVLTMKGKGVEDSIIVASTAYKKGIGEATELAVERINQRNVDTGRKIEYITVDSETAMVLLNTANKKGNALHVSFGSDESAQTRLDFSSANGIPKDIYPQYIRAEVAMFDNEINKGTQAEKISPEDLPDKVTPIGKRNKMKP